MAVEDFGGTVLSRPIEVLTTDHQNKADIAVDIAHEWIMRAFARIPHLAVRKSLTSLIVTIGTRNHKPGPHARR